MLVRSNGETAEEWLSREERLRVRQLIPGHNARNSILHSLASWLVVCPNLLTVVRKITGTQQQSNLISAEEASPRKQALHRRPDHETAAALHRSIHTTLGFVPLQSRSEREPPDPFTGRRSMLPQCALGRAGPLW